MNMVIVPSKHAKEVFINTKYEKRDKASNQSLGNIEVTVPIEVLHEGVRTDIYNKTLPQSENLKSVLDGIKEDFAFLFVGHWLKGDFGQDRKDLSGLIYTFLETFGDTENQPALLLKASSGTFSVTDRSKTLEKIELIKQMSKKKNLPNIYLLHGDLTDDEMNTLYNHEKVKALVSFTKGEGYGRPLAEFAVTGKPILVSKWSGHEDFLPEESTIYLDGQLTPVHASAANQFLLSESQWFTVNYSNAAQKLLDVYKNYSTHLGKSNGLSSNIKNKFSLNKMTEEMGKIFSKYVKTTEHIALKLPEIKKL